MTDETPGDRLRQRRRTLKMTTVELGKRAAALAGRSKPISASAIRNQENGTNGIPVLLADAYASVLGVSVAWILFGKDLGEIQKENNERAAKDDDISIGAARVQVTGTISAKWSEPSHPTGHVPDRWIYVETPLYYDEEIEIEAREVIDDSLRPIYPRGTFLICAKSWDVDVRDGDHVIVSVVEDEVVLEAVREAHRAGPRSAHLAGIGEDPVPMLNWFDGDDGTTVLRHIYADYVIVGAYRRFSQDARGKKLGFPDSLAPEFLREAHAAADDRMDAEEAEKEARGAEPFPK